MSLICECRQLIPGSKWSKIMNVSWLAIKSIQEINKEKKWLRGQK
jgi:hypothetical protein